MLLVASTITLSSMPWIIYLFFRSEPVGFDSLFPIYYAIFCWVLYRKNFHVATLSEDEIELTQGQPLKVPLQSIEGAMLVREQVMDYVLYIWRTMQSPPEKASLNLMSEADAEDLKNRLRQYGIAEPPEGLAAIPVPWVDAWVLIGGGLGVTFSLLIMQAWGDMSITCHISQWLINLPLQISLLCALTGAAITFRTRTRWRLITGWVLAAIATISPWVCLFLGPMPTH